MTKKPDMKIVPRIKPDPLQERAVADYSDLAEAIREGGCTWEGAERSKYFPPEDRGIVYLAGAEYAAREGIPHNQGVTLACWVYWQLAGDQNG